jgi:hypothetical protein
MGRVPPPPPGGRRLSIEDEWEAYKASAPPELRDDHEQLAEVEGAEPPELGPGRWLLWTPTPGQKVTL